VATVAHKRRGLRGKIPNGIRSTASVPINSMPTNKNALWIFSPSSVEHCSNWPITYVYAREGSAQRSQVREQREEPVRGGDLDACP